YIIVPVIDTCARNLYNNLSADMNIINKEFHLKRSVLTSIKNNLSDDTKFRISLLKMANYIIYTMYGCKIKLKNADMYQLCKSNLFSYDVTCVDRPIIT